jgi:putative transposase
MPNHIHGTVIIDGNRRPQGVAPTFSLSEIVHRFKSLTTRRYSDGVDKLGWPPFERSLWQRNYYEHIVRDETELNIIREYISFNPANWEKDEDYTP